MLRLAIAGCWLWSIPLFGDMGDRHPDLVCHYPEAAFLHQGGGGRILNVKMPPFGAVGDGKTDDTKALIKAYDFVAEKIRQYGIHNPNASFIIYLPWGTYLVSDTILYSGPVVDYTAAHPGYEGLASVRFIGENRERTVIRLRDNCPGFGPGSAKAVVRYAKTDFNNAETKNVFRHLTINTGRGNPGAVGLDFNGANGVSISDTAVLSEDGEGFIGIQFRVPPTQGYHYDITVTGFDYGISSDPYHATQNSFEYVTLRHQRKAGFRLQQSGVSARKLKSENLVPAFEQQMAGSHLVLIDSDLSGGDSQVPAINSLQGQLFVRNVTVSGYGRALVKEKITLPERRIEEFVSGPVIAPASQKTKRSLNLPVKDVPLVPWPADFTQWASVNDYGAKGDGKTDDSKAIQQAMNSGKTVVYFPGKQYHVEQAISVPASVKRVNGLFAAISGRDYIFKVDAEAAEPVLFEDIDPGRGTFCEHSAPRTVILECIPAVSLYRNRNTQTATLFVNYCNGLGKPGHPIINEDAYCRFINTEYKAGPNFICDRGGLLWVFGYKVESTQESFLVEKGGRLEVLGGVANQTPFGTSGKKGKGFPKDSTRNIVRNRGGNLSVILHTNGHQKQETGYQTAVIDEGGEGTTQIPLRSLPPRPGTAVASHPGKYINEYFLPLYIHY